MLRTLSLASLLAALLASPVALSKDDGFYLGASVGGATVDARAAADNLDFSSTDFAYKFLGGYQFNGLFAVEGGYRDFGSPDDGGVTVDPTGFDIYAVAGLPVGPIRLFGKVGGIAWKTKVRVDGFPSVKDDGFDLGAGVGLDFEVLGLALRGEVEYFDILDDTWMYTIGATFTF